MPTVRAPVPNSDRFILRELRFPTFYSTAMTIDDIVQKSFAGLVSGEIKADAEAFRQQERLTPAAFLDTFAHHVVSGYLDGRFPWVPCDEAMNVLMGLMSTLYQEFPDFSFGVYLAFDTAEYNHPNMPILPPDEVTRPLIVDLVAKNPAA